jgi:hypothetical protein
MTQTTNREVPREISGNLRRWACIANWLRFAQVALGVSGIASAIAVAAFSERLGPSWTKVCLFFAAFCFTVVQSFDIGSKANATRQACRHLNTAILRYLYVPASSLDNLIDSNSQAQGMIGGVTFRQPEDVQKNSHT